MSNSKGDIGHYRYQGPHSTLKEGPMVKCDPTIRFRADDFPQVVFTAKTSTTNNKGDKGHYKYQGSHSTLKEGSKVKSVPTKRFEAHDFL